MKTKALYSFESKLNDLEITITDCNSILISEMPSDFIYANANFLTKSFLISLCGYLETYLKDALEILIIDYNDRISREMFPYNLIRWSIESKDKSDSKVTSLLNKGKVRDENLEIKLNKKDLDSFISGNPFRTKDLFEMFGLNLDSIVYFNENKELINTIITKRNNVLHHNDDASDISNPDIIYFIQEIRAYSKVLDELIEPKVLNKVHCI